MNDHAFRLYNPGRRGGGSVELALWDLIGKALGKPLYKIWAGATAGIQTEPGLNRVMPYASQWTIGTPEERAREVQLIKSEGWKAMKLKLGLETVRQDVALMEAARKAAGSDFLLMCDGNKAGPLWPGELAALSLDFLARARDSTRSRAAQPDLARRTAAAL